jgi:hypothetical protein
MTDVVQIRRTSGPIAMKRLGARYPIAVQSSEAGQLNQRQRRTRRAQDFLRERLIVDETGKHHRANHG